MPILIPGLPEGVEAVRIGPANPDEFEVTNEQGLTKITKGARAGSSTQIIVQPAKGWSFFFDPRQYCYVPMKLFDKPMEIVATAKFTVKDSLEKEAVEEGLERLKALPGFQALT